MSDRTAYETDLLCSIKECRSVRGINILKGNHSSEFIINLMHIVQIENPRIISLIIEGIERIVAKNMAADVSLAAGRLACDYFNYSLPGVRTLCLHGCYLRDAHLPLLVQGMEINTALKELVLSRNLITDIGFIQLFESISKNQKSALRVLNLNCNLLTCKKNARTLFEQYRAPVSTTIQRDVLEIWMADNIVKDSANVTYTQQGQVQLRVIYTDRQGGMKKSNRTNTNNMINMNNTNNTNNSNSNMSSGDRSTQLKSKLKQISKFSTLKGFNNAPHRPIDVGEQGRDGQKGGFDSSRERG